MSSSGHTTTVSFSTSLDHLKPFAFLFATLILSSYLLYQWALPKPLPGIPYNVEASRHLLGDIPGLLQEMRVSDNTFMEFTRKQVAKHNSPLVQLFIRPFRKPMIVLSDFQESQDILIRRKEFDRSKTMGDLFSGVIPEHHIIKPTNAAWKAHRRLLQDLMLPPFLNHVAGPVIHSNVQNLITLWDLKAAIAGNRPFSASEDIYSAALDAVFGFAFGEDFQYSATAPNVLLIEALDAGAIARSRQESGAGDNEPVYFPEAARDNAVTATVDLAAALEEVNGKPMPQLIWKFITSRKERTKRALKLRDDYICHELKEAVRRMESDNPTIRSAVDHMVRREKKLAEKDGRKPEYFSTVMADETFGFVIGGHETTSTTVSWGLKILADNPQPQNKLRLILQDVHREVFKGKRSPTIDEITGQNIPYLDAVIEEILRCGGTTPGVWREALCDTEILGLPCPKGTQVLMSAMGPSMLAPGFNIDETKRSDSSQYAKVEGRFKAWDADDIDVFKPERWLVPASEGDEFQFNSVAGPQLAFGLGTRGCYGKRLAYLELRILVTMILWNFELLRCPEELSGYQEVASAAHRPKQCYVRLRKVQ